MKKKIRELRQQLKAKIEEAEGFAGEGRIEESRASADAAKSIKDQIEALEQAAELRSGMGTEADLEPATPEVPTATPDVDAEYRSAFFKVLGGRRLSEEERSLMDEKRALSSTSGEDGGFTIPVDMDNSIRTQKRAFESLEQFVNVETVTTLTGSRVVEKLSEMTAFAEFNEGDDVPASDTPQFKQLTYAIKTLGGFLPIPNNLINDSSANLQAYIEKWLAKKEVITINKMILEKLNTLTKKTASGIDALKKVINVDLDPMIALGAVVVTNQDGYNWLDSQKDADGRYYLQPDITQPGRKLFQGKPVAVVANKFLPTVGTTTKKAPMIIGDLKEFCTIFDRQQISIMATNVGGDAFKKNRTDVRAILRKDIQVVDGDAAVFCEVTLS